MRVATFNVQNMFDRARALNLDNWSEGKPILEAHRALNELFNKPAYSAADKRRMLQLLDKAGLAKSDVNRYLYLRIIRGRLRKRPPAAPAIVADGREDWVGWVELVTEPVNERTSENVGRVIHAIQADVLGVVEAEDRVTLARFNEQILPLINASPYRHVMLVDGNDDRGIDVGIMTRSGFPVKSIRSHVDDVDAEGEIFSRDCAEFEVGLPNGGAIWVLVNHLKSKGYGKPSENDARRLRQAQRLRVIVDEHLAVGEDRIVVLGDMNDTPDRAPLAPLLANGSPLVDVANLPNFDNGGRPGTHGNCTAGSKLDYVLLSPALQPLFRGGGIERRGMWGGTNGTLWPRFDELERPEHAASDHAGVWADIDV
jgi:endonuclease/exonuclease/phosphatase family metal-dependent hydrolase